MKRSSGTKAIPLKVKNAKSRIAGPAAKLRPMPAKPNSRLSAHKGIKIVRVACVMRHGGTAQRDYKSVFLCGLDSEHRIIDGEWLGYMRSPIATYPFVLEKEGSDVRLAFEGGEDDKSSTTAGRVPMQPGELFTVFGSVEHDDEESWYSRSCLVIATNSFKGGGLRLSLSPVSLPGPRA